MDILDRLNDALKSPADLDPAGFTAKTCNLVRSAADEIDRLRAFASANDRIGPWLSAALDDPQVCREMKADITAWFDAQPKDT